jgi:TonB family protein
VRLLHHASDAGCHLGPCRILVTNFIFPDGSIFPNGIEWADELSFLFATQEETIQVVDRTLFKELLQKKQISAKLQSSEPAARWLGKQLRATVVLVGKARMSKETIVEPSARFLNVDDDHLVGPSSEVNLQVASTTNLSSLTGLRPPPSLPPFPDTVNGEKVYHMGESGVGAPSCYYMPNPSYTEAARKAHFSGTIIAEGVIGPDGSVNAIRIVSGAPFGLNEEVVKIMKTWKCKPALLDGKPVATLAPR